MILKRMCLEGRFVEAFPYLDFIWLVAEAGEVFAFDAQRFIEERMGGQAEAAAAVFARNDRLILDDRRAARIERQSPGIRCFVGGGDVLVSKTDVETYSTIFAAGLAAKSVLDLRCYYRRAFVATESKIAQLRLFDRGELAHMGVGARGNGRLGQTKVHDGRCVQFRSRYGVVSAACGRDGGFYANGAAGGDDAWRADFRVFAPRSHATEFVGFNVANVTDGVGVEIYDTTRTGAGTAPEPQAASEGEEDGYIERVTQRSGGASDGLESTMRRSQAGGRSRFRRTFLTTTGLFAFDAANGTHNIKIATSKGLVADPHERTLRPAPGDVIGFTTSPLGVVAELDTSVHVLSGGRWTAIQREPVFSVRGYPSSKWYRQLLTLACAEHTDICFACEGDAA